MNQRAQDRQRERERVAAAESKVTLVAEELLDAATALQVVVRSTAPLWNSWQPKLMMLGSAVLELNAARAAGLGPGLAQVGRVATSHGDKELSLAPGVLAAAERVLLAANRAALLPDSKVRDAALLLAEAAMGVNQAYSKDALWHAKKARIAREAADAALDDARRNLMDALITPPALVRVTWWRRAVVADGSSRRQVRSPGEPPAVGR